MTLFAIDAIIVEGFTHSRGANSKRVLDWAAEKEKRDGFQEGGEAVPAIMGARAEGAVIWGGEPDDADILAHVRSQGFSDADVLGFYTLRSVPQWIRERKISSADDERVKELIVGEIERNRNRLGLTETPLPDYDAWLQWYSDVNEKPFGGAFDHEETGPLADGEYGSNKVAAAISRARAASLQAIIVERLNARETVMVVFGASHLMLHEPALNHMLGAPCYKGDSLKKSTGRLPMTEVLFYHLERARLEGVLPGLLEKSLERGWKAVVRAGSRGARRGD